MPSKRSPSIFFGFYNGLGDLVSDLRLMAFYEQEGYRVAIGVTPWLKEIAKELAPYAAITVLADRKAMLHHRFAYDYIFLTPNYLHPLSSDPLTWLSYLSKYLIVRLKADRKSCLLSPPLHHMISYLIGAGPPYLRGHFYEMSRGLVAYHANRTQPPLPLPDEVPKTVYEHNPSIKRLYIFPFSGKESKNYPLKRLHRIARRAVANHPDLEVRFFVTEKERTSVEAVVTDLPVVCTDLPDLSRMFDRHTLLLCSDSGPGHLGTYRGAHAVVLFGPTPAEKYLPMGEGKIVAIQSPSPRCAAIEEGEIYARMEHSFDLGAS